MPIQGIRTRISEGPLKTSSLRDEKEETNEAKKKGTFTDPAGKLRAASR